MEESVFDIILDAEDENFDEKEESGESERCETDDESSNEEGEGHEKEEDSEFPSFEVFYRAKKKSPYESETGKDNAYIESEIIPANDYLGSQFDVYSELIEKGDLINEFQEHYFAINTNEILFESSVIKNEYVAHDFDSNKSAEKYIVQDEPIDVTVIKYETPVSLPGRHRQYVHQEIEINSYDHVLDGYELTKKTLGGQGFDAVYDERFNSVYVKEINGVKDGYNGRWWEVHFRDAEGNIEISQKPIDQITPDDMLDERGRKRTLVWCLASEEPGGCGGVASDGLDRYANESYKKNNYANMALNTKNLLYGMTKNIFPYSALS